MRAFVVARLAHDCLLLAHCGQRVDAGRIFPGWRVGLRRRSWPWNSAGARRRNPAVRRRAAGGFEFGTPSNGRTRSKLSQARHQVDNCQFVLAIRAVVSGTEELFMFGVWRLAFTLAV